ncbi:hypothetical protein NEOKW01_0331 [Nematocida sp. AWRm80]|nr:hypothetical protein NEOKW01_0331 [Nematocida sp. AWRm80]
MTYISTQREAGVERGEMTYEELKRSLSELSPDGPVKISREELVKMITTTGDKLSITEANQVLSLIPKEEGYFNIEDLLKALY